MDTKRAIRIKDVIIKAIFFFAFPAAWATGFSGVKYLCTQIHSGQPIEMKAFLIVLLALLAFTILFGRFFCSKACAFGTYGDVLYAASAAIAKRLKRRPLHLPVAISRRLRYLKFVVLIAVCVLCILGFSSAVAGGSPWTAFSHFLALKVSAKSRIDIISIVLFALCSVLMLTERRAFCKFLCPFGAVFALMPVMPFSIVKRDKGNCISGCKACGNVCIAGLELPYRDTPDDGTASQNSILNMGECFECGKCANICPKRNASCLTMPSGKRGIAWDIAKAAILLLICIKLV